MKTLKKTALTLTFLLFACFMVKAELPNRVDKNVAEVLSKYIASVTTGEVHDFKELLSDDFIQHIDCNRKGLNYNKKQFIASLKLLDNFDLNCTTDYSLVEEKDDFVIAKVDMKFPTFTKTNYVTMSETEEGWKITNISVHYD